jgi:hypothetical protein
MVSDIVSIILFVVLVLGLAIPYYWITGHWWIPGLIVLAFVLILTLGCILNWEEDK